MYLGILLVITGSAVFSGALSGFIVVPSFIAFINRYQILPEEASLQKNFGESFTAYARKVRRWL